MRTDFVVTVYMDKSDVTDWIRSVEISQMDSINRRFVLYFNAWHSFDESNRWDIFGSYDTANPRDEILIRNGIVPTDRPRRVLVSGGARPQMPTIVAEGYEYVWLVKRRGPKETIIAVPGWGNVVEDVTKAIEEAREEVGAYRVWTGCSTLHRMVYKLARAAGVRVSIKIPDYPMVPYVVPKELSYWKEIERLTDPYAPHRYYARSTNTLVIADKQAQIMGAGNKMTIPADIVESLQAIPRTTKRVRRVIASRPPWR
jgi:hypothetical protein